MNDPLPPPRGMILERHPSMPGPASRMHEGGRLLIGYWHMLYFSDRCPPDLREWQENLPDPKDFVDEAWDSDERAYVAELLSVGTLLAAWKGYSFCRICDDNNSNGTLCLTFDGTWGFPQGFAHYVRDHGVRPPQEFIDHVLGLPEALVAELRNHTASNDAIVAEWDPLYKDTSKCPDKGTACKYEDAGDLGFQCTKKLGPHGSSSAYGCLWAMDSRMDAIKAERARHWAALEPFRKNPWTTAWETHA